MIRDVILGVAALLEPDDQVDIDEAAEPAFDWTPNRLYGYANRQAFVPIESGPGARQDFDLTFVFVADDASERATRERSVDLAEALDRKADAYCRAIRQHSRSLIWDHIRPSLDVRPPATLTTRALAVRVTGYRLVA